MFVVVVWYGGSSCYSNLLGPFPKKEDAIGWINDHPNIEAMVDEIVSPSSVNFER